MKILRDEDGQTLVIAAIFMALVSVGFLAFAVDVGRLFAQKRMAQAAADSAALVYAQAMANSATSANALTAAKAMAKMNGFDTTLATNPAIVTSTALSSGTWSGFYQVQVSRPIPTGFMAAVSGNFATVTVSGVAVAGAASQSSSTCVCLEGGSGETLNMSNNAHLSASGCGIRDDSSSAGSIQIVGSANVTSLSIGTVSTNWDNGTYINNGGSVTSSHIVQGMSSTCASGVTMPTAPTYVAANCVADPGGSFGTFSWGPASSTSTICYSGLTVGANGSTCTLNPGIYVINGGNLHFESGANNASNQGGNGVFFYLTNGATLTIDNGANVSLVSGGATESDGSTTAPTTASSYNGILFFQDTSDTNTISIQGGSNSFMAGSIYAPAAPLSLGNGSTLNLHAGIVASSLTMNGGGTVDVASTTLAPEGSTAFGAGGTPKLVQ
jgi:Putative Flp pilus-assembly TadE/G-like